MPLRRQQQSLVPVAKARMGSLRCCAQGRREDSVRQKPQNFANGAKFCAAKGKAASSSAEKAQRNPRADRRTPKEQRQIPFGMTNL